MVKKISGMKISGATAADSSCCTDGLPSALENSSFWMCSVPVEIEPSRWRVKAQVMEHEKTDVTSVLWVDEEEVKHQFIMTVLLPFPESFTFYSFSSCHNHG